MPRANARIRQGHLETQILQQQQQQQQQQHEELARDGLR
jgi:hypothetical protein